MSRQTNAIAVTPIGIDTGKNTLHLIWLDEHGTIVLREKLHQPEAQRLKSSAIHKNAGRLPYLSPQSPT
jgi:hypothetical protein